MFHSNRNLIRANVLQKFPDCLKGFTLPGTRGKLNASRGHSGGTGARVTAGSKPGQLCFPLLPRGGLHPPKRVGPVSYRRIFLDRPVWRTQGHRLASLAPGPGTRGRHPRREGYGAEASPQECCSQGRPSPVPGRSHHPSAVKRRAGTKRPTFTLLSLSLWPNKPWLANKEELSFICFIFETN